MRHFRLIAATLLVTTAIPVFAAVQAKEDADTIVLDNGVVGITVNKHGGTLTSIRCRKDGQDFELGMGNPRPAMVYDFDNHTGQPRHFTFNAQQGMTVKLASATPESADVEVNYDPTTVCPFNVEFHWILRDGDSGFYTYIVYRHHKGMPECTWEQTRAVIWGQRGTDVFTNYVVDDRRKGPFPTGQILSTVFDTTWKYAFDNTAHSKYETSAFMADDLVHGMAGHGVGIWLIAPSREYVNGGPLRQELTVHQDSPTAPKQNNVVLWMLQGNHFGGPNMPIAADQEWTRFYGPCMVYVNQAATVDQMWEDAKKKGKDEESKWPYAFVKSDDYPLARGSVTGLIRISTGDSPKGAWVVLAEPGEKDWCMSATGYEFWTRADADGRFTINKVRPGKYALFVTGGNQFEDFMKDDVEVSARTTDLGTLNWTALTHGKTLWQIGMPDRSTQEFKGGDDVRHFVNYLHYGEKYPDDVAFTIGKSKENVDWNYAQWGWYSKRPYWSVLFDQPAAQTGKGTLTIAVAAYDYPRGVLVRLNGQEIGKIDSMRKSGMSAYRCGGQDSLRQTVYMDFDASLIKAGKNELQLEPIGAVSFDAKSDLLPNAVGAVMYDAIRMEVGPS